MNIHFAHPMYLWALLGLIIPLWMHFYHRKAAKVLYYSDLSWLEKIHQEGKGLKQIQKIWLLLARLISLFFLILGFANPLGPIAFNRSSKSNLILYIDNSPTQVLAARKSFLAKSNSLPTSPNGQAHVFFNDFESQDFEPKPWPKIKEQWNQRGPGLEPVKALNLVKHAQQIAEENQQEPMLYWFSDFPKNKALPIFPNQGSYILQPFAALHSDNVFVDSVYLSNKFIRPNTSYDLIVRMKNGGTKTANKRQVSLYLNDFMMATQSVNLEPSASTELKFSFSLAKSGVYKTKLMSDDPVAFDNSFYFLLQSSAPRKIYVVGNAQNLEKVFEKEEFFEFKSIQASEILPGHLPEDAFVCLVGIENRTATDWKALNTWVSQGHSLAIIPNQVPNDAILQDLNRFLSGTGKQIAQTSTSELPVQQVSSSQSFFQAILAKKSLDKASKLWTSKPLWEWNPGKGTLISWMNAKPFLEKISVGQGSVFLFSSQVLSPQDGFNRHGLFLPVWHEMVLSSGLSPVLHQRINSKGIEIKASADFVFQSVEKSLLYWQKQGKSYIPEQNWLGKSWICRIPQAMMQDLRSGANGFIDAQVGGKTMATFALNYPKEFSELATYSKKELEEYYAGQKQVSISQDLPDGLGEDNPQTSWAMHCFALALFFFFVEMALVLWNSRSSRTGSVNR
ncbi:BatA domain-containing protein [Aquirufa aurantiipilula]